MRKRMLSILLSLCMLFSLAPASVFVQDELEEAVECVCETECSEESKNIDCPVCSKEGVTPNDCRMYVPVIEESNETIVNPINENNDEDSTNNEVLENEGNEESNNVVLESEEPSITSKDVQDLIDALPDTTTINEDNVEDIEAQLEAIDNLKTELSDEELNSVDFTRYVEVATVLEQILYGVQEPSNIRLTTSTSANNEKEVSDATSLADALADSTIDVVKLVGDIDISSTLEIKRSVTLDLSGYVLKMTTNSTAVKIFNGGNLTLIDSNPTATHYFDTTKNLWQLSSSGFEVLGGIITNTGQASAGSGVYIDKGGSFTMNGANIVGCKSSNSESGGVYNEGTFILNSGTIQGYAGGLYNKGIVNGNGGLIANYVSNHGSINVETGANGTTFTDAVKNYGGIAAGIFNGIVQNNNGNINGGTFNGQVNNNEGNINNGTFNNKVVNEAGKIYGGTFKNVVENKPTLLYRNGVLSGLNKALIYNGIFTETSEVSVDLCDIYNGTFKGKVTFNDVHYPNFTVNLNIWGIFTETSEVTISCNQEITAIIEAAEFNGIVRLNGQKIFNRDVPVFGETSTVYLNAGTLTDGIFYGMVFIGGTNLGERAYRKITFDTDGGSLIAEQKILRGQKPTVPDKPTKTGYVFGGWLKDDVPYSVESPLMENVTVKANWVEDNFTVKFDTDGGSAFADKTNVKWDDKVLDNILVPTKAGYTFNAWKYNDIVVTENTKYSDLVGDGVPTSITLKADWNVNQYTITFDTNGGSNIAPITQDFGSAIVAPSDPIKTGYTFIGWDKEVPSTMPAEDMTINALWSVNKYTISFDTDGGSEVLPIIQDYGSPVLAPIIPTKVGFTFNGWDKEIPSIMPSNDMLIKALWKINKYTITFDTNGGSNVDSITQDYGSAITKPSNPTKEGYTFIGWDKDIPSTMPAEDMTINALWSVNKYTISFDTDGGSEVLPIIQDYGSLVLAPLSPTKVGFTFNGWDKVIPSIMPSSDMLIKALWKINKYTITFDTNGGSNVDSITQDYGSAITKPSNPTKEGYTFIGWDISIPNTMPANNMTIKAKWKDSERPSGEIKVATNSWKTLLNSISFGLFFKDSQTVSISAIDNSNEEVKIEYLLSNSLLSLTELDNQTFNLYTKPFNVNPNNEYVIYAKLTDTSNNISYISSDGLVLDDTSPLISGVEDTKTYCDKRVVTVNDKYINSVKVNGNDVTLDSNNSFVLGYGKQNIIATDRSGNKSEVNVTINNGHSFGNYNFDSVDTHTRKCNICGSSETYKCIDGNKDHKCDVCNGQISKCADLNKNHKCDICGKILSLHKGGEAFCTKKSICDICGQEYGELSKHLNLKHIEETKATTTSIGNKEYWYCEECNRYYSDKDGLNEISKEDTIIERLKADTTNIKDDNVVEIEHKDSNPIIWVVVSVVGVAIISGIILIIKRKR